MREGSGGDVVMRWRSAHCTHRYHTLSSSHHSHTHSQKLINENCLEIIRLIIPPLIKHFTFCIIHHFLLKNVPFCSTVDFFRFNMWSRSLAERTKVEEWNDSQDQSGGFMLNFVENIKNWNSSRFYITMITRNKRYISIEILLCWILLRNAGK